MHMVRALSWFGNGPFYTKSFIYDDVIKWKKVSALLARCEGLRPVTGGSPQKGQWLGALLCFFLSAPEQMAEQTIEMPVIREPSRVSWRHFSDYFNGT